MEPITRRQALRAAALAAGGVSVVGAGAVRARAATAELPPPFSVPFVVPETLSPVRREASTDHYETAIRPGPADVLPGRPTPIWGYDGRWPGPTIRAVRGRRVVVRQRNQLRVPVAVHLHGAHVAAADDGHPLDLIHHHGPPDPLPQSVLPGRRSRRAPARPGGGRHPGHRHRGARRDGAHFAALRAHLGCYVYHCHQLPHEDHDMMAQLEVVP